MVPGVWQQLVVKLFALHRARVAAVETNSSHPHTAGKGHTEIPARSPNSPRLALSHTYLRAHRSQFLQANPAPGEVVIDCPASHGFRSLELQVRLALGHLDMAIRTFDAA